MKKTLKMGLIGFVMGAAVAVGSATLGAEETVAAPCCSLCDDWAERCSFYSCNGDPACEAKCEQDEALCWSRCNYSC
ncbi:hypothetical protein [Corallococcus coralloides]|uniref:hypothetical protein n=1 Tax=Corallococcus coralloides TaxID=184914 RepID=UPI0005BE5477|nr:hypothetical protein [Corallococcus coralloides]